ncbi:Tim10/DDP family zinc finger protein [Rossellomorea aquimaris]
MNKFVKQSWAKCIRKKMNNGEMDKGANQCAVRLNKC